MSESAGRPRTDAAWTEAVKIARCGPNGKTDWNAAARHLDEHAEMLERELESKDGEIEEAAATIERLSSANERLARKMDQPTRLASHAEREGVVEQEPCAWRYRWGKDGVWRYADKAEDVNPGPEYEREPLYPMPWSAPSPAGPDALAEELAKKLDTWASYCDTPMAHDLANAATLLRSRPAQGDSRDAERMDWLIDHCPYWPLDGGNALPTVSRAAIDAAMSQQEPK